MLTTLRDEELRLKRFIRLLFTLKSLVLSFITCNVYMKFNKTF